MSNRLKKIFELYKERSSQMLGKKDEVKEQLNLALQKLMNNSSTAKNFFENLKDLIQMVTFWVEGKYTEIPYQSVLVVFAAILYFVNPMDLIPDVIPALGFTDDAAVLTLVLKSLGDDLEKFRSWKSSLNIL